MSFDPCGDVRAGGHDFPTGGPGMIKGYLRQNRSHSRASHFRRNIGMIKHNAVTIRCVFEAGSTRSSEAVSLHIVDHFHGLLSLWLGVLHRLSPFIVSRLESILHWNPKVKNRSLS